jgi:predicted acylesterase/phospholipase RssA
MGVAMARTYAFSVRDILILTPPERRRLLLSSIGMQEAEGFHNPEAAQKVRRVDKEGRDVRYRITVTHSAEEARRLIRKEYFNVLVIDEGYAIPGGGEIPSHERLSTKIFLQEVTPEHVADFTWRADRTLVLIESSDRLSDAAFAAGRLQVGGYASWPFTPEDFFEAVAEICRRRAVVGKTALCLAGGGIEGLIYEVGALRALDELLIGQGVNDFDIYCGISAGAIAGCFLANGVPPAEFVRAFHGDSTLVSRVGHRAIFYPAWREIASRAAHMVTGWFLSPTKALKGLPAFYMKAIPSGFFSGDRMRKLIRKELERPGRTDRFRSLEKELYIGATDQDTSEHVVFGDRGWDDVRISDAVRASAALVPFYAPAWVRGRWFVDGSYTRTSELEVAIAKGATLVVIVDPLVPIRSGVSGYVRRKGGLFSGIQGVKALVHTRFVEGYRSALEKYPHVDFIVIVPEEDDMRLMSGSPMRYNYRIHLEELAYQETLLRVEESYAQFSGELMRHGFQIRQPEELRAERRG